MKNISMSINSNTITSPPMPLSQGYPAPVPLASECSVSLSVRFDNDTDALNFYCDLVNFVRVYKNRSTLTLEDKLRMHLNKETT